MRRLAASVVCAALFAAACGDDGGDEAAPTTISPETSTTTEAPTESSTTTEAPSTTTEAPSATVVTEERTFVDASRITKASGDLAERSERTIDAYVDALDTDDVRPLIVFSHGLTGHPESHRMLRTHLAEVGFIVVSPVFPLTNGRTGTADAGDIEGQVGDVSFVIDSMLADERFGPLIDADRIGAIGHSLGGLTTAGAALRPDTDQRISAAAVLSAGFGDPRDGVAVLVLHGDGDRIVPVGSSIVSYSLLEGRRMLVTLLGGDHNLGIGDDDSDYGPVVRDLAAAFFAHELDHDPSAAVDRVTLADLALATVEAGTGEGPLEDWTEYFSAG
ncbi:MAG: hypothetical protein AAF548_14580 [Actinomycetota bacterium]